MAPKDVDKLGQAGGELIRATSEFVTQVRATNTGRAADSFWSKNIVSMAATTISLLSLCLAGYSFEKVQGTITDPDYKAAHVNVNALCDSPLSGLTAGQIQTLKQTSQEIRRVLKRDSSALSDEDDARLIQHLDLLGLTDEEKRTILALPDMTVAQDFSPSYSFVIASTGFDRFMKEETTADADIADKLTPILDALAGPSLSAKLTPDQDAEIDVDEATLLIRHLPSRKDLVTKVTPEQVGKAESDLKQAETILKPLPGDKDSPDQRVHIEELKKRIGDLKEELTKKTSILHTSHIH
ncbi:hypothetical protein HDF16_005743 [Granulicella aggregans]|uniref:Uncharacterized protein n=1 Tax=Granulicella aggregans TaxID=474949 RepID=A0A7W8E6T4_9BACT|nr:hypothetical protein [Granulicella aggregans]MBB5061007.1 hypothetical protein [Granulicella aggregans]